MTKRNFTYILILMAISLIGVAGLQWYWVNEAIDLKEEEFAQNVQKALTNTVDDLESAHAERVFEEHVGGPGTASFDILLNEVHDNAFVGVATAEIDEKHYNTSETELVIWADTEHSEEDVKVYSSGNHDEEVVVRRVMRNDTTFTDTLTTEAHFQHKIMVLGDVMERMIVEEFDGENPVETRLSHANLDSLLASNLLEAGVSTKYNYAVSNAAGDSLLPGYSSSWNQGLSSAHKASLFPHGGSQTGNSLLLDFPSEDRYVIASLGWTLILSIGFVLFMLCTFAFTIFYMLRQKKISEVKSDFINNMTHELKTPLATIGLAADSIRHPEVKGKVDQVEHFSSIITQESKRLNEHVEKVLQLARMERGEIKLKPEEFDFNDLVTKAATNMQLQAEAREGSIELKLSKSPTPMKADKLHIYNVVLNLVDNAIKYCQTSPSVILKTTTHDGMIELSVEDNGVGMTKKEQSRIFDSFYRAEGGNVHSVKGFGLGLSYVHEIVRLHEGAVSVESQPNKGTRIQVNLPALA